MRKYTIRNPIDLFVHLILSYVHKLVNSRYYNIAIKELSHNDREGNYILLTETELKEIEHLIFTDNFFWDKGRKTIGFKNTGSKKIFIYQFSKDGSYKRIKCDSAWHIYEVSENIGKEF